MARDKQPPAETAASAPLILTSARVLLGLLHVVCSLFFYTNLTRNPYLTQIALLNIGIATVGLLYAIHVWQTKEWVLPRISIEWPLAVFLIVAFLSSIVSWLMHASVRPGILAETMRIWVFTLVNSAMVVYLPLLFLKPVGNTSVRISIWTDIGLTLIWGALWFGFHSMKGLDPKETMWDTYGAFLWVLAIIYTYVRSRRGEAVEFFHLIFSTAFLAGLYGILQYWGRDIIWNSPIQPYGGRPVSTFGNPNFLSSYLVMVSPVALGFAFRAEGNRRWGYLLVSLVCMVGMIVTLTRSSYVGLMSALIAMAILLYRKENAPIIKNVAIGIAVFVVLIFLFPKTPISGDQSPLARFTEIYTALKSGQVYHPWHQRLLIWSSAWDMLNQSRLFGIGWGTFELFYPFFQGRLLLSEQFRHMRTHANNAHNVLLEIWSQTGFIGTAAAIWLLVVLVISGWLIVKKKTEGNGHFVTAGLLAGAIGMTADNFFGNVSVFFAVPAFLFWWNVGSMYNESHTANIQIKPVSPVLGRVLLIALMAFSTFAGVYYYKRWQQEIWYFIGFRESKTGDIVRSYKALETAVNWFSREVNTNYELGNSYARHGRNQLEKGLQAEGLRFTEKALAAYQLAVDSNPGYDEIYFNRGVIYSQIGQLEKAAMELELSIFINPLLKESYGPLGNLYIKMANDSKDPAVKKEKIENAVRVYSQATEVFPGDKDYWNTLGYGYSQLGDHSKAFDCFRQSVFIDPAFAQAWSNLADASRITGRKDPIMDVPRLIKQMEDALTRQNYPAALASATRIVEIIPANADARLSIANIHFYMNQFEKAETEYKKAIELRPDFNVAHTNLGRLYQFRGNTAAARDQFQKSLQFNPNDAEAKKALSELQP